ncbi:rod-binding protein [Selenihalanaerobacter shriftii]|uniref:Flagellar protein FlgJ n=1 Tax=Selenihalanaerobacter shriftii TaxID=142842 RepID=A0A1T4KZ00_9FIRM|nr:rod-binding protein [Selenihalanaerobacter shriftii]SJZ47694.1 flagellar protein FlgJ [Selenihalanaerobacter shriftii]
MKISSNQSLRLLQTKNDLQRSKREVNNFKQSLQKAEQVMQSEKERETKLREVSKKFSALFVGLMLKEMRKTIPKSGYLNGGLKEDIFRERLDQKYAQEISRSQQLDMAEVLYKQLNQKIE